jgi:hypothetical protein
VGDLLVLFPMLEPFHDDPQPLPRTPQLGTASTRHGAAMWASRKRAGCEGKARDNHTGLVGASASETQQPGVRVHLGEVHCPMEPPLGEHQPELLLCTPPTPVMGG